MENYEKHYREIEKLTDNPFLNLYHIDALGRDGTPFHYYFASRNGEDNIKHKTHSMSPEGMAVYAVTEDGQHLVLVRRWGYPSARRFRKQPNAAGRCSVRLCRWFPCRMQEQMRTAAQG